MWILWHGGHNYSHGYVETDAEPVASLTDAKALCEARYDNRDGSTPCVDETSGASVWFGEAKPVDGDYPDRLIVRGKRGAWKAI